MRTLLDPPPQKDDVDPDSRPIRGGHPRSARTKLSPRELAAQWGKDVTTIIALIRMGELRAIDVSVNRGRRTFLIDLADIAIFEERRMVQPPAPRVARRRRCKAEPDCVKFFD